MLFKFHIIDSPGELLIFAFYISPDNRYTFSNTVLLKYDGNSGIAAFPNTLKEALTIKFHHNESQQYHLSLIDVTGQQVFATDQFIPAKGNLVYHRDSQIIAGTYFL